jgi:hypothetical protein
MFPPIFLFGQSFAKNINLRTGLRVIELCKAYLAPTSDPLYHNFHRYYVAGFLTSASILLERKSRRSVLALYVFPRAVDALYTVLYHRKLVVSVPFGEVRCVCVWSWIPACGILFLSFDVSLCSTRPDSISNLLTPQDHVHPQKKPCEYLIQH